jgi:hypothetical protein
VGFLSKLKEKSRGVMTKAEPAEGVASAPESEVRDRLRAISGHGIETGEDDGAIVVAWAAKVASVGPGGGDYTHVYRAIRVELEPEQNEASGICFKTDSDAELGPGFLSVAKDWERGQHVGSESFKVIAWLGPVTSAGGAVGEAQEASYRRRATSSAGRTSAIPCSAPSPARAEPTSRRSSSAYFSSWPRIAPPAKPLL